MTAIVASAVAVLPDDSEMDSNQNGLKRRQSDTAETEDSKRQRTSSGKNSPENPLASKMEPNAPTDTPRDTPKPTQKDEQGRTKEARRRSAKPDDKQRSKRLFGALLGNLNASQPNDRAAKRRADIEARRKAELAKQDNVRLEDKQRRLRELAQHRKRKQIYMDEQDMHTRHRNLLDIANMLQTKAEPKLYYRPWDLLPEEETQIEDQLAAVRTQVDEELAAFAVEKKKRLAALEGTTDEEKPIGKQEPSAAEAASGDSEKTAKTSADSEPALKSADPDNHSTNEGKPTEVVAISEEQSKANIERTEDVVMNDEKKEEADDDGEQVVEGDEDNVIY